jgi:uncharacterized membrane protein
MTHLAASALINAPVEKVFAFTDDYHHTTAYMHGLSKWEPAGSKTHGMGATFAVGMKAGPLTIDGVVEITDWAENRLIGWTSRSGINQSGRWSFRSRGADTQVSLDEDIQLPGGIAGRVVARLAEPVLRGNAEKSVVALKAQIETLRG